MKFKFLKLNWDLEPVFLLLGSLWLGWCMFGPMAFGRDTPAYMFWLWGLSVFITLAATPTLAKLFGEETNESI